MATTKDLLAGWFKHKYGEFSNALESFAILQKRLKLTKRGRVGDEYRYPVQLRNCHGVSWAGGSNVGKVNTLNDPESLLTKEAQIASAEFYLQEDVAYGVLTRAAEQGEAAFGDAMGLVVSSMLSSAQFYKEVNLLYGNTSIGAIAGRTVDSGTTQTFQLTQASWAPGIWANMEGAYVDVYDDDFNPIRNTAGTLKVTAVDPDAYTITLTGTESEMDTIVADDVIVPRDAQANGWFSGIADIIGDVSGSFQNIDADTYHMWRPNAFSAGSTKLTMAKALQAVLKPGVRGLMGDTLFLTNPYAWQDLNEDHAALRRLAQSTKTELDLGTENITYYGITGKLEIEPHPMVKAAEGYILQPEDLVLIGSTDITHKLANISGMENHFYQELESKTGVRLRCMYDLALTHTRRARTCKVSGIVPASMSYTTASYV